MAAHHHICLFLHPLLRGWVVGMVIRIQRKNLSEMLQAVREKEKTGYECVTPIQKIRKPSQTWRYYYGREFFRIDDYEYYVVKMRKVAE
jgi:hypothetical protein